MVDTSEKQTKPNQISASLKNDNHIKVILLLHLKYQKLDAVQSFLVYVQYILNIKQKVKFNKDLCENR